MLPSVASCARPVYSPWEFFSLSCVRPQYLGWYWGIPCTIRIKANAVMEREIEHLLSRLVQRPSRRPKVSYHSFQYQAQSWLRSRRVVAKVTQHAKYVTFQLAEVALRRCLFAMIQNRIARLAVPPAVAAGRRT